MNSTIYNYSIKLLDLSVPSLAYLFISIAAHEAHLWGTLFYAVSCQGKFLLSFSIDVILHNTVAIVGVFQSYRSTCSASRNY